MVEEKNSFCTRHPPGAEIIFDEYSTLQHGFEPMTPCLPGRHTTNWAMVIKYPDGCLLNAVIK